MITQIASICSPLRIFAYSIYKPKIPPSAVDRDFEVCDRQPEQLKRKMRELLKIRIGNISLVDLHSVKFVDTLTQR